MRGVAEEGAKSGEPGVATPDRVPPILLDAQRPGTPITCCSVSTAGRRASLRCGVLGTKSTSGPHPYPSQPQEAEEPSQRRSDLFDCPWLKFDATHGRVRKDIGRGQLGQVHGPVTEPPAQEAPDVLDILATRAWRQAAIALQVEVEVGQTAPPGSPGVRASGMRPSRRSSASMAFSRSRGSCAGSSRNDGQTHPHDRRCILGRPRLSPARDIGQ